MKGIDTNVLVRYLVRDDPDQTRKARRFITEECSKDVPGLVNRIVLCEVVWVLESTYDYPRDKVALALGKILRPSILSPNFVERVVGIRVLLPEAAFLRPTSPSAPLRASAHRNDKKGALFLCHPERQRRINAKRKQRCL